LIRFALYGQLNGPALLITLGATVALSIAAIIGFDPGRGLLRRAGAGKGPG